MSAVALKIASPTDPEPIVIEAETVEDARRALDALERRSRPAPAGTAEGTTGDLLGAGEAALEDLARAVLAAPSRDDKLALVESLLVTEALRLARGNKTAAARLLGVHRKVVERRVAAGTIR